MKIKTPLILFVVLLLLAVVAVWEDWHTKKKAKEDEASKSLTSLTVADVDKVTYYDSGALTDDSSSLSSDSEPQASGSEITITKIDGKWRITAPLETSADAAEVEDFIKTVLDYRYDRVISDSSDGSVDLAEYGLDKPKRKITLLGFGLGSGASGAEQVSTDAANASAKTAESISFTMQIGDKAPVGYSAYFSTAGDKVYTGSQYIITSTAKSLFSLRDKRLLEIDSANIKSIYFWHKDNKQGYTVVREGGVFQLRSSEAFKTSQKKVKEFIGEFNRVRIEEFFDAPSAELQAKFTSAKSLTMTVVFELNTGETKSLSFVRDRGDLLVAFNADKAVFKLPAVFEETLNNLSGNFRDHSIFNFNAADIAQVKIDGEVYRLVEGKWYLAADHANHAKAKPYDNIQVLLDEWETAEALGFVDKSAVDDITSKGVAHKVELTISTPTNDTGEEQDKQDKHTVLPVLIWQQSDQYYLKVGESDQLFRIAKSIIDSITPSSASVLTTE